MEQQLPVEKEHPTRSRDVLVWTLASTLVVLAVLGGLNARLRREPNNDGYALVRHKWQLMMKQRQPVDWLILGDSSGSCGVEPEILEQRLGGSALNLCVVRSLQIANDSWMLQWHQQHLGTPRTVVVVHAYDVWYRTVDAAFYAHMSHVPLPAGFWHSLAPDPGLDGEQAWRVLLGRWLPVYTDVSSARRLLFRRGGAPRVFEDLREDGFSPLTQRREATINKSLAAHLAFLKTAKFEVAPLNRTALDAMVQLADKQGFRLCFVQGPILDELYNHPDFQRYYAGVRTMYEELERKSSQVTWIRDVRTFPRSEMQKPDHTLESAAKQYSIWLAEQLQGSKPTVPQRLR